ncbi:MAG: TIGR00282 family metallophosphoesterase [Deltaproteobacteria bacterium]|nr:TIGR00282 family metallophosphoesterase [Deltaproteobacteria bacterium]
MAKATTILYVGDVIGKPGRSALKAALPGLSLKYAPDLIIVNGENSAGGFGITPAIFNELLGLGVDVVTSGNHIWDKREIIDYIDTAPRLLRPANYPIEDPGSGVIVTTLMSSGVRAAVVNISGRVFMDTIDCPFRSIDKLLKDIREETPVIFVDFHAEATSEKKAMGHHLDGRVSAVIGSHTHVQTSDEVVLGGGTAYLTDAGMTGPVDSVIGIDKDIIIKKFLTKMPIRYEVAGGRTQLQGVVVEVTEDGKASSIERLCLDI